MRRLLSVDEAGQISARPGGRVRAQVRAPPQPLRGTRSVPLCLFSYRTNKADLRSGFRSPVGFELRLDLNPIAVSQLLRLLTQSDKEADQNGALGIQVEAELERYRLVARHSDRIRRFDWRRGKAGCFAYRGTVEPELEPDQDIAISESPA